MTRKALKVARNGIKIQPNRIVCLSPDSNANENYWFSQTISFAIRTEPREHSPNSSFLRLQDLLDASYVSTGLLFRQPVVSHRRYVSMASTVTSSTMKMTPTDAIHAFPAISTVERRLRFSREATSGHYRLYLDFESRVIQHRSISSSIFALSIFKLYCVRYFEDTIPLYVSVLCVSYRNAFKTREVQDSIFTNGFTTSA